MLYDVIVLLGCQFIGYMVNEGYEFVKFKVFIENDSKFVGLLLDDENQF